MIKSKAVVAVQRRAGVAVYTLQKTMTAVKDKPERSPAHILCVAYQESLLLTRALLLEGRGYKATSSLGFEDCIRKCQENGFDLFIVGHSIPEDDQWELMKTFREYSTSPVLLLRRQAETTIVGADYYAFPDDPEELLRLIADILSKPPRIKPSGADGNTETEKRA